MPREDEQHSFKIRTIGNLRREVRPEILRRAQELRRDPAPGEMRLWHRLRAKRLGFRFHYQAVLRGWIADFWCPAKRLVVEVDGWSHRYDTRQVEDGDRDNTLRKKLGIETLRFPVERVYSELNGVVDDICRAMANRPTSYICCGSAGAVPSARPAKNQLESVMLNRVGIGEPESSPEDKAIEAIRLYCELRGDVLTASNMDEFGNLDRQFSEIEKELELVVKRVKASGRGLKERLKHIQESENDEGKSRLGRARIMLGQEKQYHCKNSHRLEVKPRKDGSRNFWGCPEYPRCTAKGRSLTREEEARLEQLAAR